MYGMACYELFIPPTFPWDQTNYPPESIDLLALYHFLNSCLGGTRTSLIRTRSLRASSLLFITTKPRPVALYTCLHESLSLVSTAIYSFSSQVSGWDHPTLPSPYHITSLDTLLNPLLTSITHLILASDTAWRSQKKNHLCTARVVRIQHSPFNNTHFLKSCLLGALSCLLSGRAETPDTFH